MASVATTSSQKTRQISPLYPGTDKRKDPPNTVSPLKVGQSIKPRYPVALYVEILRPLIILKDMNKVLIVPNYIESLIKLRQRQESVLINNLLLKKYKNKTNIDINQKYNIVHNLFNSLD